MPITMKVVTGRLISSFLQLYPAEAARHLNRFTTEQIVSYLGILPAELAIEVYRHLNIEVASDIAATADTEFFKSLFAEMEPSIGVAVLSRLDKENLEERLKLLPHHIAAEYRDFLAYPEDSAGRLMDPQVTAFHSGDSIAEVGKRLRAVRGRRIIDVCVVDDERRLLGVVPLHVIAMAEPNEIIGNLITEPPISVAMLSSRDEVVELLEERRLASLPVLDYDNRLMGIIRHDALLNAAREEVTEDIQTMFGAGRDERALSKVPLVIKKRLPWLEINLATAFLAAFVVGLFETTIGRITALAVFLPVVAGQSGNTGAQALSVTMRGLALREVRTKHWLLILRKELMVGLVNGLLIAVTTAVVAFLWMRSPGLAAIIGIAMIISMIIASLSGAAIPLILKKIGQDPATSSSIILTTITDVVGFLSFLGLATLLAGAFNLM